MRHFLAADTDERLAGDCLGGSTGECGPVHGKCVPGRNGAFARDAQQEGACAAQFFFQQPGGGVLSVRFQGI